MITKTCTKCNITKPLTDFYTRIDNQHGVTAKCIECTKAHRRQYYLDNIDKEQERNTARAQVMKAKRRQDKQDAAIIAEVQLRAAELFRARFPDEWAQIDSDVLSEYLLS